MPHPDVAGSYRNIGNVYDSQGRYEEALFHHQKALEVFLALFGQEHSYVASCYQNIAATYQRQGNEAKATEMCTKAYRIFLKVLGPDHPQTLGLKRFVKVD